MQIDSIPRLRLGFTGLLRMEKFFGRHSLIHDANHAKAMLTITRTTMAFGLLIPLIVSGMTVAENTAIIDRQALVMRHAVERDHVDIDPRSALQVGNGDFAFNADVTGLQTFHGQTLSNWGWHEEPLPEGMKPDDRKRTAFVTQGRERHYLAPHNQAVLARWLNDNPHKAGLGRLRFVTDNDGDTSLKPKDITRVRQKLDLWRGKLISDFELKGKPVHVETVCHPDQDVVAISIQSPLLAEGGLSVVLDFPYPGPKGDHWDLPERHATRIARQEGQRADLVRTADAMNERASRELRSDEWKGNLWGCDYPMMAMTAARLGKPEEAVDWLLNKSGKNSYPANGFCEGWYLPGNGALLWAVAMMTAGWDGAPARHAPGFPADGSWVVKWEGLKIAP